MVNPPLVSIIIPTFNRAHLLSETLHSVLTQTYTNWECLVVDDGSTDDTEYVVKSYVARDARIQFHIRPKYKIKGANACRPLPLLDFHKGCGATQLLQHVGILTAEADSASHQPPCCTIATS